MSWFEDPLRYLRTPFGTQVHTMYVTSVDEENRTVTAVFASKGGGAKNIVVVKPTRNDYSLPQVDDRILVVFDPYDRPFMLGVVEENAAGKIKNGELRRPNAGEVNIFTAFGTRFVLNKIGDIKLEDALLNGLRSLARKRELRLASRLLKFLSSAGELRIGDVKRALPGQTEKPIQGTQGGSAKTGVLQELFFDFIDNVVPAFRYMRLRVGDVVDELGVPEVSSQGRPLRVKLEVTNRTGTQSLGVEIDHDGNVNVQLPPTADQGMQLLSTLGDLLVQFKKVTLDATTTINLGSNATEPAVLGQKFADLFAQHTHPTAVGPSGVPSNAANVGSTLSAKVLVK